MVIEYKKTDRAYYRITETSVLRVFNKVTRRGKFSEIQAMGYPFRNDISQMENITGEQFRKQLKIALEFLTME